MATTPERTVTTYYDEVTRIMRDVAYTIRTERDKYKHLIDPASYRSSGQLADLLDVLGDDMADGQATEVRIHSYAADRQVRVVGDYGRGPDNDIWTAALALARTIVGGYDDPVAYRLTDASFGIAGGAE